MENEIIRKLAVGSRFLKSKVWISGDDIKNGSNHLRGCESKRLDATVSGERIGVSLAYLTIVFAFLVLAYKSFPFFLRTCRASAANTIFLFRSSFR
jgi:hypothetical protein